MKVIFIEDVPNAVETPETVAPESPARFEIFVILIEDIILLPRNYRYNIRLHFQLHLEYT